MTLDLPDAFERALDEPAFSNGTECYAWMGNWCGECSHDSWGTAASDEPPFCPLIEVMLHGRTPAEWLPQRDENGLYSLGDQYHCVYFRDRDDPGGREPVPVPDPPGQLELLPRGPYEGVRMYADTQPREAVPA